MITSRSMSSTVGISVASVVLGAFLLFMGGKIISSVDASEVRMIVDSKINVIQIQIQSIEDRLDDISKQLRDQNILLIQLVEREKANNPLSPT